MFLRVDVACSKISHRPGRRFTKAIGGSPFRVDMWTIERNNLAKRVMLEIVLDGVREVMAKGVNVSGRRKARNDIEGAELAPMLEDFLENSVLGDFLDHIGLGLDGLPPACDGGQLMATVKQFYVGDGELNMNMVAGDLASYPPIAAQIREGRRAKYQESQSKKGV